MTKKTTNENNTAQPQSGRKLFQFQRMSREAGGAPIEKIGKYGEDQPHMRALNKTVQDERLSAKAVGVLAYLLSLPPNWEVHSEQLAKRFDCGERAIRAAMKELNKAGYARRRVVRSPDRKHAVGTIWDIRESPDIPWSVKGKTRDAQNVKCTKRELHEMCTHTNDVLMTNQIPNTNDVLTAQGNSIPATPKKGSSSDVVVEDHQHHQKQPAAQPARDHIKWPEFVAWCESQKGKRAKDRIHVHDGVPTEDGFWKWLLGQKPKWRNKVRPRAEIDGYDLDGKFYEPAAANELLASNPEKYVGRFRKAVKRRDRTVVIIGSAKLKPT